MSKREIIAERIEERAEERGIPAVSVVSASVDIPDGTRWLFLAMRQDAWNIGGVMLSYDPEESDGGQFDSRVDENLDRLGDPS